MSDTPRRLVFSAIACTLVALLLPSAARAEDPAAATALTATQLEALVAPVALYPDPVLAVVLPASTMPLEIVRGARALQATPEGATVSVEGFDPAVQALFQYADVLVWMDANLEWTEQLGYAVATQQADVLQAVQAYRARSVAAGSLVSGEQVTVVVQPTTAMVTIVPADPEVIYVPVYEPTQATSPGAQPLAFATGVAVGALGAWALHELVWDDDFHIHVHGGPYRWDAVHVHNEININRGNNVRIGNDVDIGNRTRVGNDVRGTRWSPQRPVTRPARMPVGSDLPGHAPARPRGTPSTMPVRHTGPAVPPRANTMDRAPGASNGPSSGPGPRTNDLPGGTGPSRGPRDLDRSGPFGPIQSGPATRSSRSRGTRSLGQGPRGLR